MILKQMIVNPYFGELMKAEALKWEFNPAKGPKTVEYTGACGLVGTAVSKAAADGQSVWLSGHVGDEDWLSLDGLAGEKGDKKIHFPFLTIGWASKDEALQALALDNANGKQKYHKVLFEVSGAKALKFVDCRLVCHRLNGTVTKEETTDNINTFKLAAVPLTDDKTVEEWEKHRKEQEEAKKKAAAEAAAAGAAAGAAMGAADMAMGAADMMMDAPKIEGDGM